MPNVPTGENGIWNLSILFPTTVCDSTMISIKISMKKNHTVNSIRPVVVNAIKEKNRVSKILKRKLNIAGGWI